MSLKLRPPPAGQPDRVFILPNGISLYVEFKSKRGLLTVRQQQLFQKMIARKIQPVICNDVDMFKRLLDFHLQRK